MYEFFSVSIYSRDLEAQEEKKEKKVAEDENYEEGSTMCL